jgi:hypothetical protein
MSDKGHVFTFKVCHWWGCKYCGLLLLNNNASRKESRKPCKALLE